MIFIEFDEIDAALPDVLNNLGRDQLFDRFHKASLAVTAFWGSFSCTVVESFGYRIRWDHLLHVVPELAEQLVVETYRPVLTQKLHNIRYEAIIITLADLVKVFVWQTHERHQRRHDNLLAAQVRHVFDDAIRVYRELYVMSFEVFDCLGYQLLASNSFL